MIYLIIASLLLFYSVYTLISIVTSLLYKAPNYARKADNHSILVFFPVYKANKKLVQNLKYMRSQLANINAKIYVLSQDSELMIDKQIESLSDYFDSKSFSSLKGNSYHHALEFAVNRMESFSNAEGSSFDSILILDPDNTMNADSINRLIQGREDGADVVLSKRASINQDGSISLFDGISERLNDYMLRKSKHVLRLIPELSGSGMMVEQSLFRKAVLALDKKAPGMDKQLLINMMFQNKSLNIVFDEQAVVYDEKTTDSSAFNRQRLRWFGNQYYNAKKFGLKLLFSGRLSLIDYAIVLCRPPRSFQVVASFLFIPVDLVLFNFNIISLPIISISALVFGLSLIIFLTKEGLLLETVKKFIPFIKTSIVNGITVFKSLKNDKEGTFIHTRNTPE